MPDTVPSSVLDAYGFSGHGVAPVSGGLINATYVVNGGEGNPIAAVQRLHPVFAPEVNLDIEAVTDFLVEKGLVTPRLLRTNRGEAWCTHEQQTWRAITWVSGRCYSRVAEPALAEHGAELVGRFHRVLKDFDYRFQFSRPGVHNTAEHFRRLHRATAEDRDPMLRDAHGLRNEILAQARQLPALPVMPTRICHGDLKISNLLFDERSHGLCLIDLDTLGYQNIACELGDALRSWGNPSGEDTASPTIDIDIIEAAARGYARGSQGLLTTTELESVIVGVETISLELASRFCLDAFEDRYFGWNDKRYKSRRQHNILRAKGQLALSRSVARHRAVLQECWIQPFSWS